MSHRVEMFFDGDCPLCRREVNLLRKWDRKRRVLFTDLAAEDFDPSPYGLTHDEMMQRIHGRRPDGTIIEGMDVFRDVYGALGLGWLMWPTTLPGLSRLADAAYRFFARNRLRWTGRCASGSCALPGSSQVR